MHTYITAISGRIIPAILFLYGFAAGVKAQDHSQITFSTAEIDTVFASYNGNTPGCAVGVTQDGNLAFAKGYGLANMDYGIPITPDSRFMIASISKQFTAAALLMMEQEGLIDLDENLRTYLPELPRFEDAITPRNLIHHTSGLRDMFDLLSIRDVGLDNTTTPQETLEIIISQLKLNFEPNSEYLYSNSGYFLMSFLVERLTGKTLREYTDEHLFRPSGMVNTHFHDNVGMIVPNRAESYTPTSDGPGRFYRDNLDRVGARGLFTTINDFAKWDANFIENKTDIENFEERMIQTGVFRDGRGHDYATGLRVSEYRKISTVGHGGNYMGFRTGYLRFPEYDLGIIVFCNMSNINPAEHVREVADILLKDKFEDIFSEYTGYYQNPFFRAEYRIGIKDGKLFLNRKYKDEAEIEWIENDRFRTDDLRIEFQRDSNGTVNSFKVGSDRTGNILFIRNGGNDETPF